MKITKNPLTTTFGPVTMDKNKGKPIEPPFRFHLSKDGMLTEKHPKHRRKTSP
jgi:hypothetical protein